MDYQELIERLRKAVISPFDLGPVAEAIESMLNALDVADSEVKRTAAERDAALAELAKYRDAPCVAYATTNEEDDLTMLFFDEDEARKYSGDDEPIKLIVKPGENK